jgi:hypothetical protein
MPDDPTPPAEKPANPPLPSPRHEKFAQLMATGEHPAWFAYTQAYPLVAESTCRTLGPKLFREPHIKARVAQIQGDAAADTSMQVQEYREYLSAIARTPVGEVDEMHMLAQKVKKTRRVSGKGEQAEEWETESIEMPSKLGAVQELAKHHGWNKADKVEVGASDDLMDFLARIRQPGIPREPARDALKPAPPADPPPTA